MLIYLDLAVKTLFAFYYWNKCLQNLCLEDDQMFKVLLENHRITQVRKDLKHHQLWSQPNHTTLTPTTLSNLWLKFFGISKSN